MKRWVAIFGMVAVAFALHAASGSSASLRRIAAPAEVVPLGIPIDTIYGPSRSIRIADRDYTPYGEDAEVHLVVVDRTALTVVARSYNDDIAGLRQAEAEVSRLDDRSLVILALPDSALSAEATTVLNQLLEAIGAKGVSPAVTGEGFALSAVGVRGWVSGAAYQNVNGLLGATDEQEDQPGDLHGYLQKALGTQAFGFVFGDFVPFDTRAKPLHGERTAMRIGDGTLASPTFLEAKYSGFHVVVLDAYSLRVLLNQNFATNGAGSADGQNQENLGKVLRAITPSQMALVQSFGSPQPTTIGWNSIADGVAHLGGSRSLIDDLDGRHAYALVGSPANPQATVESFEDRDSRQSGSLGGLLARTRSAVFGPLLSDPSGLTEGNQLLQLAYRPPSQWPLRDKPGPLAAIKYISKYLNLGVDDPLERYRDLNIHWNDEARAGKLERLQYEAGHGYTLAEFDAVKIELLKEFAWVTSVRTYIDNLRTVLTESVIIKKGSLEEIARQLQGTVSGGAVSMNAFDFASIVTKIAGNLAEIGQPEFGPPLQAISGGFALASGAVGKAGEPLLGQFETTVGDVGSELTDRFTESLDALGLLRSIILTDHDKLAFAGTAIEQRRPGWRWDDETIAVAHRTMGVAARQLIYTSLLRIPYVTYRLPGDFQDPDKCRVLGGEPPDAWLSYTDRFVLVGGQLRRQTTAWAIGTRQEDDRYGRMKPDAKLIAELFARIPLDSSGSGLGVVKQAFITRTLDLRDLPRVNCITR